ncbi:MAG: MFS transporter, partial [Anaerolineae bacterium]|nr:MFS transporter [Anaerolineae bacterium]
YWSLTLSVALLITAVLSPILGTISDLMRGKKRFLSIFVGIGVVGTAALVLVGTGDWLLASAVMIVARIGFTGANTFYDALLPHVAREADQDAVSTRGYAMGYLGGGLLLAINVVMIFQLGFEEGARWSFLSVALWWALFSIPIFRQVPEPPAAVAKLADGVHVATASFQRIWETLKDARRYRELFKFLIAFLIYNDAIGTIIGVAAIYGTELGFSATELILALLLVQFVGIPFSLIFGWLPSRTKTRRPFYLAFILFNLVALPVVGMVGAQVLPQSLTGVLLPPYETVAEAVGTGVYSVQDAAVKLEGGWGPVVAADDPAETGGDRAYVVSRDPLAGVTFHFYGQEVVITYNSGPDLGQWQALLDGEPVWTEDADGAAVPLIIDAYSAAPRYGLTQMVAAEEAGEHLLQIIGLEIRNPASSSGFLSVAGFEVLAPVSASSLPAILGLILAVQAVGLVFAWLIGQRLVAGWVTGLDTQRSILLALVVYSVIAVWGFILRSTIEFWFLAWMVAMVQGGSQALSRSLYATLSPASKSGEFFGLFGVMEKFSAFLGPLIFALAVALFGSSRPAILALNA